MSPDFSNKQLFTNLEWDFGRDVAESDGHKKGMERPQRKNACQVFSMFNLFLPETDVTLLMVDVSQPHT